MQTSLQKSSEDPRSRKNEKNITIDQYDTDSDEEDRRREEEEIKRIIMKARMKALSKSKGSDFQIMANDVSTSTKPKPESYMNPASQPIKGYNQQAFFPVTASSLADVDKKEIAEEIERSSELKSSGISKQNYKARDVRALLEVNLNNSVSEKKDLKNMLLKANQSPTKLPEIKGATKDLEFHKQSFNNLLSLYERSTTSCPVALFTEKTYFSTKPLTSVNLGSWNVESGSQSSQHLSPSLDAASIGVSAQKTGDVSSKKEIKDLVDILIKSMLLNAFEPLDKKDPYDIPRLKLLDWPVIMKKIGSKKFELLIIDPINFLVEDCKEINAEDPQNIKDLMNEAIIELSPTMNEAKHLLVYYYEEATGEKKLLFTKFFFFIKNHKFYDRGFKTEKEVVMHYLLILALLELRANYETNPFKMEKIEVSKKKAYNIVKKSEAFPSFVSDWLAHKIQPIIVIEKVYVNLNVGGKADSNFFFNMHEHLMYTFPAFTKIIQSMKAAEKSPKKTAVIVEKPLGSRTTTFRDTSEGKETDREKDKDMHLPIPSHEITTRDHRTTQRVSQRSSLPSKRKVELALSVVDISNKEKKDDYVPSGTNLPSHNQLPSPKYVPISAYNSVNASPPPNNNNTSQIGNQTGVGSGSHISGIDNVSNKPAWPKSVEGAKEEKAPNFIKKNLLLPVVPQAKAVEQKVRLSSQRMNTNYGQLLKHRFAKQNVWSQKNL